MKRLFVLMFAACAMSACLHGAQAPQAEPDAKFQSSLAWNAKWINDASSDALAEGVYVFRKTFELKDSPKSFIINVSADNRYRLFVNGEAVATGPAAGNVKYWYYDTIDIAPFLKKGKNTLAAVVWNFGVWRPAAQMSSRSAFLLQGNSKAEEIANTNVSWKVARNEGRSVLSTRGVSNVLAGGMEKIDGSKNIWGWELPDFDDSKWGAAGIISAPTSVLASRFGSYEWPLAARDIPMMEERPLNLKSVRRADGIPLAAAENIVKGEPLEIPANSKCSILFDQTFLTSTYPELVLSGGAGAKVEALYGENLWDKNGEKGNRSDIVGKTMAANAPRDIFLPDGGKARVYRPLWFRTYRFVELLIETKGEPLVIEKYRAFFTGYPFKEVGKFSSSDKSLEKIWEVGWRTARLCAHETYFDCPFYERLQYTGDTRIQALISLYVAGDARLMRKAILSYDISRDYMGITHSRTPCWITQLIPPFALYWVNMVEDYRMHRDDPEFVRGRLNGIKSVINWYMLQIDPETGFLRADTPYWNFVDWVRTWPLGIPPSTDKSGSVLISLHFVSALEDAAKIMREFGCSAEAEAYQKTADSIKRSVYEKCWNPERGLLRDCLGGEYYSQHTNVMGILTNTIPLARQRAVFERITDPANVQGNVGRLKTGTVAIEPAAGKVSEATFYYKFYVVRAMKKVGLADGYLGLLNPWREMIDKGLTTFSENPDPCRSECHAWSSSPNYDFLATVCGVEPDSAGFASVKVQPHLGGLSFVKGTVPHPKGLIEVELERADGGLKGKVVLPSELSGRFIFGGREIPLKSGENKIDM